MALKSIALAAYVLIFTINVNAAPVATSTTSTGCGLTFTSKYTTIGPVAAGLDDSCFHEVSSTYGTYTATSNVQTGFGPAVPKVGVVDAAAAVLATGTDPHAPVGSDVGGEAIAAGSVRASVHETTTA